MEYLEVTKWLSKLEMILTMEVTSQFIHKVNKEVMLKLILLQHIFIGLISKIKLKTNYEFID